MSDEEYFEQLCSNSLDGTLTDSEREKLEAHLAECPSCAALKDDLERMRALFSEEIEPPASLHEGIMQRLEQESKLKVVRPEKPARRMPVFTMVAAAAVVVLVVLGGGLMPMFSTVGNSRAADAATAEGAAAGGSDADAAVQESAEQAGISAYAKQPAQSDAAGVDAEESPASTFSAEPAPSTTEQAADAEASAPTSESADGSGGAAAGPAPVPGTYSVAPSGDAPQSARMESVQSTITVPESLRAMSVAHCYLAQGGAELPDIGGELLATDDQASWFLLDNDLVTLQETLGAVEDAGFTVSDYVDAGLTIDSKASSWLLIVVDG